ncbi:hypothetical protein RXV86_18450 [Alisedimentitalea sp. MJ-SS2]|uniref:hypothetical protein n=1 Tax=Aliisedimentitalea sp. MJ-SS2 TaxID=3049795 RepID=UPI00290A3669|nr:hypothetical protein [Alisedimentitalea sp. MJ-SS2]MDU8929379.1 hypothetical protein [Alisedimentitalea sp. MJ-SS2]
MAISSGVAASLARQGGRIKGRRRGANLTRALRIRTTIDLAAIQAAYDAGADRKTLYHAKKALLHLPDHTAVTALAGSSAGALGLWDEAESFCRSAVALGGCGARSMAAVPRDGGCMNAMQANGCTG